MDQKNITFTGTFLTVDNNTLEIQSFKKNIKEKIYTIVNKDSAQIFSFHYHTEYMKVQYSEGSAFPRNPNVINTKTKKNEPNPRKLTQVEPREHFALIDFKTNLFWLSNQKKRNILMDFLKVQLNTHNVIAKDVYDKDQFIKILTQLDKIRFALVPNLFNENTSITNALKDEVYQYEAVEGILEFKYENKLIGNNLYEKIKSLFSNEGVLKNITISGRDNRNLGMLFNSNGFARKIEFSALVDSNEMFLVDDVFFKLISNIENEKS